MAYIYKITNCINQKSYIGKTMNTIEERFKEHQRDSHKEKNENRPLYSAFNKYRIENFSIEELEKCSADVASEREKYWIEKYGTFKCGYNATTGGDGKPYIDYDLVVKTYNKLQSQIEVARILNIHEDSVHNILKEKQIEILTSSEVNKIKKSKEVGQFDLNDNLINVFPSINEASRKVKGSLKGGISNVCNGKRKTHNGFKWKFI